MAEMKSILYGGILVLLFSLCLITFFIGFQTKNNPSSVNLNNAQLGNISSAVNRSIGSLQSTVEAQTSSLSTDQPSVTYLFLLFKSAFYIPIAFIPVALSSFAAIFTVIFPNLFGSSANPGFTLIFAVIDSLIGISLIIAVIYWIRTGYGGK